MKAAFRYPSCGFLSPPWVLTRCSLMHVLNPSLITVQKTTYKSSEIISQIKLLPRSVFIFLQWFVMIHSSAWFRFQSIPIIANNWGFFQPSIVCAYENVFPSLGCRFPSGEFKIPNNRFALPTSFLQVPHNYKPQTEMNYYKATEDIRIVL